MNANNSSEASNIVPLVSVLCQAYNHEPYISECLDGIMMQKTDFRFEVLVHDDASTDRTADIIREYEAKYPDIIKPIYQTENQFSQGKRVFSRIQLPRAKAKYIAICEGDDYWTDPLKLQKQVGFLEENEEYSMCFHNAIICRNALPSDTKIMANNGDSFPNFSQSCSVDIKMLIKSWIVPTASMVYRRKLIRYKEHPLYGDQWIILTMAESGSIYYMSDTMSVYRILPTGMNSNSNSNPLPTAYKRLEHAKYIRTRFKQIPFITASALLADRYWSIFFLEMKNNNKFYFKYLFLFILNDPIIVFRKINRKLKKMFSSLIKNKL